MTSPGSPVPPPPDSPVPAAAGPPGQMRTPIVVILLWLVTLGIYGLFWQYRVFEDLKQRTGQGVGGAIGLLLGLCISIVNLFLLPAEIGNMYAQEGLEKPVTGLTGFLEPHPARRLLSSGSSRSRTR